MEHPLFSRTRVYGEPHAPEDMLARIAQMWHAGADTLTIAKTLKIRECAVYNSLRRARAEHPAV